MFSKHPFNRTIYTAIITVAVCAAAGRHSRVNGCGILMMFWLRSPAGMRIFCFCLCGVHGDLD